jgi:hypothetical protein
MPIFDEILDLYKQLEKQDLIPCMVILHPRPSDISQEDWDDYIQWLVEGCPKIRSEYD